MDMPSFSADGTVRPPSCACRSSLTTTIAAATFERDEVTEHLEDRFGGQGHRAELRRRQGSDHDPIDELRHARFGGRRRPGERVPFNPPSRNTRAGNGGPVRGASGFRDLLHPSSHDPAPFDHGRNRPMQRSGNNHARAPSPRAAGTIRFQPDGKRILHTPSNMRALSNSDHRVGLKAAAAMQAITGETPRVARRAAPPVQRSSVVDRYQAASAAKTSSDGPASMMQSMYAPRSLSDQPIATSTPVASTTPIVVTTPATSKGPSSVKAVATSSTAKVASKSSDDPFQAEIYRNQALWYAANPGPGCNDHYTKYKDRAHYLGEARDFLVKEALTLIYRNNERATQVYVETHPERKWMVEAAAKAKEQIENGDSKEELERYCLAHRPHTNFLKFAKNIFSAKPKPEPKLKEEEKKGGACQSPSQSAPPQCATETAVRESREEPTTQPAKTSSVEPAVRASSKEPTPELSPSSSARTGDSFASAEMTPLTPAQATGTLTTTFYDVDGGLLGTHTAVLAVPAQIAMSVTSMARHFDPRGLKQEVDKMAKAVRAVGQQPQVVSRARFTEEGLWEEDLQKTWVVVGAKQGADGLWSGEDVEKSHGSVVGAKLGDDGLWNEDDLIKL